MTILTDTTLEKFNKWYYKKAKDTNISEYAITSFFHSMHFLLQFGMLDAFFNKHGYFPTVIDTKLEDPDCPKYDDEERYHTVLRTHDKWTACGFHKTKIEAQKEAIVIANEKFNDKYKNQVK